MENLLLSADSQILINAGDMWAATPLWWATFETNTIVAQGLLRNGAEPSKACVRGVQPAHMAAANGDLELLTLLERKGADLLATTLAGETPLHFAAGAGHVAVVRWLLARVGEAGRDARYNHD